MISRIGVVLMTNCHSWIVILSSISDAYTPLRVVVTMATCVQIS